MSDEPESLILRLLRDVRAEIGDMRTDVVDMRDNIVGLRRVVVEYHTRSSAWRDHQRGGGAPAPRPSSVSAWQGPRLTEPVRSLRIGRMPAQRATDGGMQDADT